MTFLSLSTRYRYSLVPVLNKVDMSVLYWDEIGIADEIIVPQIRSKMEVGEALPTMIYVCLYM